MRFPETIGFHQAFGADRAADWSRRKNLQGLPADAEDQPIVNSAGLTDAGHESGQGAVPRSPSRRAHARFCPGAARQSHALIGTTQTGFVVGDFEPPAGSTEIPISVSDGRRPMTTTSPADCTVAVTIPTDLAWSPDITHS